MSEQLNLLGPSSNHFDKSRLDHPLFNMLQPHIVSKFWIYHKENPHIFDLYLRFARELRKSGRRHYGIGCITERIRWHVAVETKGEDFKMGNNHRSCYARLLCIMYPEEFNGFFQLRTSPGTVEGGRDERYRRNRRHRQCRF